MNRNTIVYSQWTFTDDDIHSGNMYLAMALMSDALEANTFTATVECADRSIINFERNTPLTYSYKGQQRGIFYVQSITRDGPTTYTISATSAIGLLIESLHYGGIYTGQTVAEVLPSICGTVPYVVKTNLREIALYGWLPVASSRDNLSQVLFAIGASIRTDLDGVLHIEGLWDGVSWSLPQDRMYRGPGVEYSAKVTRVVVTEHQYMEGGDETNLFEGTAQEGDIITFEGPMYALQAAGFSILEQGANYAKISAGSGTLKGRAYLHNTRQVAAEVLPAQEPNVKTVTDATLVSLVNSLSVARRVANYYRTVQTIRTDAVYLGEAPGDLISAWHPYDRETVSACLESADIFFSHTLRASESLLVGFVPESPAAGYFTITERITADGFWVVPDGVTHVRAAVIGAGSSGWTGLPGSPPEAQAEISETSETSDSVTYTQGRTSVLGGAGGNPGEGGDPGKVYVVDLDVSPGESYQVSIGLGGVSAPPGPDSVAGGVGTETTFGPYSSAMGTASSAGWLEETSGEILAAKGERGLAGGSGSGRQYMDDQGWQEPTPGTPVTDGVSTWRPGADSDTHISDEDGNYNTGDYGQGTADAYGGYGGGAAYGANGNPGYPATEAGKDERDANGYVQAEETASGLQVRAQGAYGGFGADALPFPAQTVIGSGGRGGNGGGGAGSPGNASARNRLKKSAGQSRAALTTYAVYDSCRGGTGSKGSTGGPGGVILYYALPVDAAARLFMTSDRKTFVDKFHRRLVV